MGYKIRSFVGIVFVGCAVGLPLALADGAGYGSVGAPRPPQRSVGGVGDPDAPFVSGAKYVPNDNSAQRAQEVFEDPNYVDCGQSCFYSKSNENISLQIDHILEKLDFLNADDDLGPATNDQMKTQQKAIKTRKDQQKFEVLGSFCSAEEKKDGNPDRCIDRYKKTMDFFLVKMRSSLATNEQSEYLMGSEGSSRVDPPGTVVKGKVSESTQSKKSQVAYFTKSKDLGRFIPPEDLRRLLGSIDSLKPNPEDFVKFKKIPRDPDDLLKGYFIVPDQANGQGNGQLNYDQEAYRAALEAWQGSKAAAPGVRASLAARVAEPTFKAEHQLERGKFMQDFSAPVDPSQRSKSRELYDNARKHLVDVANGHIQKSQTKQGAPVASVKERMAAGAQKTVEFKSIGLETVESSQAQGSNGKAHFSLRYDPSQMTFFENEKFLTAEQRRELENKRKNGAHPAPSQ